MASPAAPSDLGRALTAEMDGLTMDGYLREKGDTPDKRFRFLAGKAMKTLTGKAPAKEVAAFLRERIAEVTR